MAEIGSLEVSLSLNASNFNGSIAQVNRQMTAMGSELRALSEKGDTYGKSVDGLGQKQNILSRQFDAAGVKLQEQRRRYDELVASGTASEAAIERQANAVNRAQADYNRLERQLAEVTEQLRVQSSGWTQAGQRMQEIGGKLQSVGESMTNVGKKLSLTVTAPLVAAGAGAFKMAVDFESAFAGVRKTVDTSEEGFKKLEQGIRDMAKQLPASASDIASVAESAGQLGIAEDKILSFSRTIIDLGESTNMTREQAATEFARFANIVGMSQDNFDRLGSSIVGLGNTMATTESEIMSMGMRLAAQGKQVGMSEAQIMALAGTMSSLGIQAEMGGTAMTTVLKKMQGAIMEGGASLGTWAEVAQMSSSEFKKLYDSSAIDGLDAVVKGLATISSRGENLTEVLKDMGIKGIYESDVMMRMAGASDLLSSAVNTSTNAWKENTALSNEAAQRYETTASQMAMLKNQIVDVGISIGNILIPMARDAMNIIGPWVEKFGALSTETQKTILVIGGLAAAIGPLLVVGGTLISSVGTIISAVGGFSIAIGAAGGATTALGATLALVTGPIGLTVAAIAGIGVTAAIVAKEVSKTSLVIEDWSVGVSEATKVALGGYLELSDGVSQTLSELYLTSTKVTSDMAKEITTKYDEMNAKIVEGMKKRNAEQLSDLQDFFMNSSALTSQEEEKIIANTQRRNEWELKEQNAMNENVKALLQKAADEKRELTEREREIIDNYNQSMKENAVRVLSESELEQKVIMERMKENASKVSAEQAAEVVKNAVKQKDEILKEANETYEKKLGQIIKMRDETGDITAEEADRMIAEAKRSRDETIKLAEDRHSKIVDEAQKQADEHVNKVNWETGELLSKWQVYKKNVSSEWKQLKEDASKKWDEMTQATVKKTQELKDAAINKITEMALSIGNKMIEVKTKIEKKWSEAQLFLSKINLTQIGKDIVAGLIKGISEKFDGVKQKVEELASKLPQWARDMLGIKSPSRVMMEVGRWTGEGLAVGIESTQARNESVMKELGQLLIDVTKSNQIEVTKIADEAEKERTKIQQDAAKKKLEIENKLGVDLQKANNTISAKKKGTTANDNIKIQQLKETANAKLVKLEQDTQDKLKKVNDKAWSDMVKKEEKAASERLKVVKQYIADKESTDELSLATEQYILEQSLKLFKDGTAEKIEVQKMYKKVTESINKEKEAIDKTYMDNVKKLNDEYIKEEERLTKVYQDEFDKRRNAYYSFAGLFDEVAQRDVSGATLIAALQSQVTAFEDWQKNITSLASKGINEGLLAELQAMGPKAGAEIAALNTLTEEQLAEYTELWKTKNEQARKQTESELTELKQNTEKQINELKLKTSEQLRIYQNDWRNSMIALKVNVKTELAEMPNIGVYAVSGLIDGMMSKQGDLMNAAQSLASIVAGAFASALDIHSPSRVMRGYGVNIGEGLVLGIDDMVGKVAGATRRLAKAVTNGSYMSDSVGNTSSSTTHNTENIYNLTVNSPKPLDPYETARLSKNGWKEMGLQFG